MDEYMHTIGRGVEGTPMLKVYGDVQMSWFFQQKSLGIGPISSTNPKIRVPMINIFEKILLN